MFARLSDRSTGLTAAPQSGAAVRLCLAILVLLFALPIHAATVWRQSLQDAVQLARDGNTQEALLRLRHLHAQFPDQQNITFDLAVVAGWHGADEEALTLLSQTPLAELPDYVLSAYARSARDYGNWPLAMDLYRALADRAGYGVAGAIGQAMVSADAGQFERGHQVLTELRPQPPSSSNDFAELQVARGYLHERAGELSRALACYNLGIRHHPDHTGLRKRRALVASGLGAATVAQRELQRNSDVFDEEEVARIELDVAAMQLRWSALAEQASELRAGEAAAANYDAMAAGAERSGTVLQFDRFVALVNAYRMDEAEALLAEIEAENGPAERLPPYVLASAGRLKLYRNEPRMAAELYRQALLNGADQASPDARFTWQMGLFNALADSGDFEQLAQHVADLEQQEEPWLRPTPDIWKANDRYAVGSEAAAMHQAYREEYVVALQRLDRMLAIAPANGSVRLSRAAVKRWRGWFKESAEDIEQVAASGEYQLRAHVDQGHLALDTQAFEQVPDQLQAARSIHARDKAVLELAERWQLHKRPQLLVWANTGRSDGGREGEREYEVESFLYSSPIATPLPSVCPQSSSLRRIRRRCGARFARRCGR